MNEGAGETRVCDTRDEGAAEARAPMRVLLMAPLEGRDPASGDTLYTAVLLRHPPPGVRYTTYAEALESGALVIRGRRRRHGPRTVADSAVFVVRAAERVLRGRAMFREPYWYVSISPDAFDLVHQHLFTLRQVGPRVPAVSSAGYPLSVMYRAQEGWSRPRTAVAEWLERRYTRLVGAHTPGIWAPSDDVMTVYTEHFRDHVRATSPTTAALRVCGQGLPEFECEAHRSCGLTVGFVGRDFVRKGGPIALDAFCRLRRAHPNLKMIVVTKASEVDPHSLPAGAELVTDPSRALLTSQLLPQIDVMMLPTSADCGAPYGVLEALQAEIPVVASRLPWLDPRLQPPAVHRVTRTPSAVASAVAGLLLPTALYEARAAARALWRSEFSVAALHNQILPAYRAATHGQRGA